MGAIFFSVDIELVRRLKDALPLTVFAETGTFQGDTAELVAPLFERVVSIELSAQLHARASARLAKCPNISCVHADSPRALEGLRASLADRGVLYWLDAHWCGSETAGDGNECPLLAELDAIAPLNERSVVLIDDARLFLAPPPPPHQPAHWPSLETVIKHLQASSDRHQLWVINDVMIFAPRTASAAIVAYGRSRGVDLHGLVQDALRAGPAGRSDLATPAIYPSHALRSPGASAQPRSLASGLNAGLASMRRSEQLFVYHLDRLGIARVLDIGANTGQFAAKLRGHGYSGLIYSVEPQAAAHRQLVAQARPDLRWIALARQGAGAVPAMLDLNIAENGWSSSLREVHSNHVRAEPTTRTVGRERVYINRSADLMRPEVLDSVEALKIDVQGYEDQVLEGYGLHLGRIRLLLLELSLVECYRGGPDLFALDNWLVGKQGFKRVSLEPSYYDEQSGTVQQYDGIYFRPDAPPASSAPVDELRIGAIATSIGGVLSRKAADGGDVGPQWLRFCTQSWRTLCPRVVSISESEPPEGLEWIRTATRPSIAELLRSAPLQLRHHLLLTNADIAFTDDFVRLLPALDSAAVYYGQRLDIELETASSNAFIARGVFSWGFDFFLLPYQLLDALRAEPLLPEVYRVGEPWWDYVLPLVALVLGFPVKRLVAASPIALHYVHPTQYRREAWLANGEQFLALAERLLDRTPNSATGLLTDVTAFRGDLETRLRAVSQLIAQTLP